MVAGIVGRSSKDRARTSGLPAPDSKASSTLCGEAIGKPMTVFIEVTLDSQMGKALDAFERAVAACEDILECHLMSGDFDYLLRVAVADMRDYERVHRQRVAAFPHVARIRTAFAMRAVVPRRGYVL